MSESRKLVARQTHNYENGRFKRNHTCAVLVALVLCLLPNEIYSQVCPRTKKSNPSFPIRLVLDTSKRSYKTGEHVIVLAYLENFGEHAYYVGNILLGFWGTSELHHVKLTICDQKNREIRIGGGGGSWIWKHGTSISEKLALAYTHLRPHNIFGVKEDIPVKPRPGRYRLTATYREIEALSWTEAERRALPIPVWTQPLTSNTVTITVTP